MDNNTYGFMTQVNSYRNYAATGAGGGPPGGGPPHGGVTYTGSPQESDHSSRGSGNKGTGDPGGPGGPPDDPDDWGLNPDVYWHLGNGWVAVCGARGERGEPGPAR